MGDNKNKMSKMESVLLETLSFYEFMNMEKIVFDIDQIDSFGLTIDDLNSSLTSLKRRQFVISQVVDKEELWKRQIPPKPFIQRLKNSFFKLFS